MIRGQALLFYEPLTPKHYLDQILARYPYDIDPALVYTLLTKHPSPHPALLTFIDFITHSRKMLITKKSCADHDLHRLYHKMAALAKPPHALIHVHSFCFDCLLHYTHGMIQPASPYLAYDKIALIDEVDKTQNALINLDPIDPPLPITAVSNLPLLHLSLDPAQYLSLSIAIHEVHGLVILPRYACALIPALCTLYPLTTESVHHDFLLFYALTMPQQENTIAYDANRKQYVGCSCHAKENKISLTECLSMIRALYGAIAQDKHDFTLSASMLHIELPQKCVSLLLCGDKDSQKSALIEALLSYGEEHDCPITRIFENYGTIHLLDDSLYATGAQIGAAIPITSPINQLFRDNSIEDLYLSEGSQMTYRITSLSSAQHKQLFQPIHHIAIMADVENFRLFQHPEEVYPYINRCACALNPLLHQNEPIENELVNTAFLNDIPLIAVPNHDDPHHNAEALITWIQNKCADGE